MKKNSIKTYKKKEANVFIASTSFQLLNCIEAKEKFTSPYNILIIINNNDFYNNLQMDNVSKVSDWNEIYHLTIPKNRAEILKYHSKLKKMFINFLKKYIVCKLFIGEYQCIHQNHLAHFFNPESYYLVDDGLAMLSYNPIKGIKKIKHYVKHVKFLIALYSLKPIDFKLFTMFYKSFPNAIENNYLFFKGQKNIEIYEDTVYFIGQPLAKLGILTEEDYIGYLQKIIIFFKPKKFIYIAHRRDEKSFLDVISKLLGFEYKILNNPIEIHMLRSNTLPTVFATFYSTGILSIKNLFPESSCYAFELPKEKIPQRFFLKTDFDNVYDIIEKTGIVIIREEQLK